MEPMGTGRGELRNAGAILGFIGAALDFYSGYLILGWYRAPVILMMGEPVGYDSTAITWGFGLLLLGAVLLGTSLAMLVRRWRGEMRYFGGLMVVYGLAMLLIGGVMYSWMTSMMVGLLPWGMPAVGALMVVNGGLMIFDRLRSP